MLPERPVHLREFMDETDIAARDLRSNLRFIRWVNRRLGGTRAVLDYLRAWSVRWPQTAEPIRIVDVATGSADIPEAILAWSARQPRKVEIIALDIHAGTLAIARSWCRARPEMAFIQADALQLPFADGSVDYAISSMFLHHLADAQAAAVVAQLVRISRRGVIVNDLLRDPHALLWVKIMTLFASRTIKYDARLSIRKGWTLPEAMAWATSARAPWLTCREHLFARLTLAGERPEHQLAGPKL